MTFAKRLRELRDKAGLTERKLAAASGVSVASIHDYGLGRRLPSYAAVVKLSRALGVSCDVFADCEDIDGEAPASDAKNQPAARARKGK
jgi:transcriptional regulator with XRE-family HTH domain